MGIVDDKPEHDEMSEKRQNEWKWKRHLKALYPETPNLSFKKASQIV